MATNSTPTPRDPSRLARGLVARVARAAAELKPDRLWAPGREPPWEQTLVNLIAAIVGVYAGLATGWLSNFVHLSNLLFFHTDHVIRAVTGADPGWFKAVGDAFADAPWHLEYLVVVGAIGLSARALASERPLKSLRALPLLERRQLRFLAYALGLGLLIYYPLVALTAVGKSFGRMEAMAPASGGWAVGLRVLTPALGGLLVGRLVQVAFPEAAGHGLREVVAAVQEGHRIPTRVALTKPLLAGLVIGSGGSCGREGPVVHMGAAIASGLSARLGLSSARTAVLLACGAAAGISASFNAPMAGMMFALEIVLRDFGPRAVAPIVLAAVSATVTARTLVGAGGEISRVAFTLREPGEILAYVALGVICGFGALVYVRLLDRTQEMFAGRRPGRLSSWLGGLHLPVRLAAGGLMVGLIAIGLPQVLGNGYETMNAALAEHFGLLMLLVLFGGKLIATVATLGSGAPGGSFFPAVFLGAMLGGAFGSGVHHVFPAVTAGPGAYAAVGMGALVAGATGGALTGLLMIFELTGNYEAVLPLMVACGIGAGVVHWARTPALYGGTSPEPTPTPDPAVETR